MKDTLIVILIMCVGFSYAIAKDHVYQECKETGVYKVGGEVVMKCEAVK